MTRSLSNLVNNLSEGVHKIKYKFGHNDKNVKRVELNINIVTAFLNIQVLKMIEQNLSVFAVTKIINTTLWKIQKNDFLIHTNF